MRLAKLKDGTLYEVAYMSWDNFKDIIVKANTERISHILSYDCIVGGIDYTIDYR